MERYFKSEYERWYDNDELPEKYGVSSFKGDITNKDTFDMAICHNNEEYLLFRV